MRARKHTLLEQLFLTGQEHLYKKHQVVYTADQKLSHIYYIQKGHIATYSAETEKNTRLRSILKSKNIFPILKALGQDEKPSRFIALDDVRIYTITLPQFEKIVTDQQYTPDLIKVLTNMLSTFIDRVDNLEIARADARLIARLIFFAKYYGTPKEGETFINIPMTHAIIASSIAATRETVTRELIKLEKKGIIHYQNQKITITNLKKLEQELRSKKEN